MPDASLKKPLAAASGSAAQTRPMRSAEISAARHHAYSFSAVVRLTYVPPMSRSDAVMGMGSP